MRLLLEISFRGLYYWLSDPMYRAFIGLVIRYGGQKRNHPQRIRLLGQPWRVLDAYSFIWQFREIFTDRSYAFPCADPHPVIYDCGSNIGLSVLYYSKYYPNCRVECFEPNPKVAEVLKMNTDGLKGCTINLHREAVWIRDEVLEFAVEGDPDAGRIGDSGGGGRVGDSGGGGRVGDSGGGERNGDSSGGGRNGDSGGGRRDGGSGGGGRNGDSGGGRRDGGSGGGGAGTVQVQARDLRSLLDGEERVDFLKIDVEGAESEIIPHIMPCLHKVQSLFVEYHSRPGDPQALGTILRCLEEAGFRYYLKTENRRRQPFINHGQELGMDYQTNVYAFRVGS